MFRNLARAVVAIALAASAARGLGAEALGFAPPHGPAMGQNRYTAEIVDHDGAPDTDDYVTALRAGEQLTASVAAPHRSTLIPRIQLLDPDGADVTPALRVTAGGKAAQFRSFRIPRTGRWTVRVSGAVGTQGAYGVAFSVRALRPLTFRHQHLGNDQPQFKVHQFAGIDGALLDLRLRWAASGLPVEIRSLTDTGGAEVLTDAGGKAIESAVIDNKRRTLTISGLPLHHGDGDYSVRFRVPQGVATYDLTINVRPTDRPKSRKPVALSSDEPFLDPVAEPVHGRPDATIRLHGRAFSKGPLPRVFFGGVPGRVTSVSADGRQADVVVPFGVPGTTVSVAIENPDGQAAVRGAYFFYLQPIAVTDLVDDGGAPVRAGSTRGGRTLRLLGAHFEAGQRVRFGNSQGVVVGVVSESEMLVSTPPSPPGTFPVTVLDEFGGVATGDFQFLFKTPPTFDAHPYTPSVAAIETQVFVTIHGKDFLPEDQLSFAGAPVASAFIGPTTRTFTVPALPAGSYEVTLTDSIGTVERGPDFAVKPPPVVTGVSVVAGPRSGATGIPVSGGATVQVDGTDFHETDVVTLGGTAVEFVSHTPTRFTFVAPAGPLGPATLAITDGAEQSTDFANAVRYVGYSDDTATRSPGSTAADNLLADRGAVGDLDGDGRADDVVITTRYAYTGTRTELTRILFGNSAGALVDVTGTNFPAAGSDTSGTDNWNAAAVAIGDVDGGTGPDILIAGIAPYSYAGYYSGVRLFRNNGSGTFTLDEASAPPSAYTPAVFAVDQTGNYFLVYSAVFDAGVPSAMALGDLDKDGDKEVVVARDRYELRYVGIDPTQVDFSQSPPYVNANNVVYLSTFQYFPGTKIFDNRIGAAGGFVDVTQARLPSVGDSTLPPRPAFHARDLALGDVDKDGWLDIVETWDDPTTVSAYGQYVGSGVHTPRLATRVLINDHTGKFADRTSTWMPAATSPEFWQGERIALSDLDGDGDLDMVLLHSLGTDAFTTSPPSFSTTALRILRNDGAGTGFVDVTSTAVPALPGDGDNFRGFALAIRDVDGDGKLDILVGTVESLADPGGAPLRSTRLFRGTGGLVFSLDSAFLPPATTDTGEASDILLGDLSGTTDPSVLLVTPFTPATSGNGENLRVLDWNR
jgi:hypothetical protein